MLPEIYTFFLFYKATINVLGVHSDAYFSGCQILALLLDPWNIIPFLQETGYMLHLNRETVGWFLCTWSTVRLAASCWMVWKSPFGLWLRSELGHLGECRALKKTLECVSIGKHQWHEQFRMEGFSAVPRMQIEVKIWAQPWVQEPSCPCSCPGNFDAALNWKNNAHFFFYVHCIPCIICIHLRLASSVNNIGLSQWHFTTIIFCISTDPNFMWPPDLFFQKLPWHSIWFYKQKTR